MKNEAGAPLEIERKYLVGMPDVSFLLARGAEVWEIEQTYLSAEHGNRRVRRVGTRDGVRYFYTEKRRVNDLTAVEREEEIGKDAYLRLLADRKPGYATVYKTRYRLPFGTHTLEFDVYPFWKNQAVLEIELTSESEEVRFPEWVRVIREVTGELLYKNTALAKALFRDPVCPVPED